MQNITIKEERASTPAIAPSKNRLDMQDCLSLLGFGLLETGIGMFSIAAACICAGVICLLPFVTKAVASMNRAIRRSE